MLIPLDKLVRTHKIKPGTRVVHVGAHEAQEFADYRRVKFGDVAWIEGNDSLARKLEERFAGNDEHVVINALLTDEERGVAKFNIASFDQSSSVLPLGTHAEAHPEVTYVQSVTKMTRTLDGVATEYGLHGFEFLNLDVQGAEQMVLNGGTKFLSKCRYIYSEVNAEELYVGCTLKPEFDSFLDDHGFDCVQTEMTHFGWGDAFYVRRP